MLRVLQISVVALGLAFFLALAGLAYFSSSPPTQPNQQNSTTQTSKEKPHEEQHTFRGLVNFLFPDAISIFTFWLVIATIVLGVVAYVQIDFLRRAEITATQSANAAKQAAEATEKSVTLAENTARKQLRAYVVVEVGKLTGFGPDTLVGANIRFSNVGQTPVYNMSHTSTVQIFQYPLDRPFEFPSRDEVMKDPKARQQYFGTPLNLEKFSKRRFTPEEIAEITGEGRLRVYVTGRIYYDDVFKITHHTDFCVMFWGKEIKTMAATYCETGNDAD